MTRFWLVRHGPTHAKTMVGWTDLPADLSDTAALQRLSAHLPQAPVISSDLSRAIATADALGPRPRLPHDPALREMHFGQWETRAFAEIEAETPDLIRCLLGNPRRRAPPRRRKLERPCQPHLGALDRLQGLAPDIIVVAHFGPILTAVQRALAVAPVEVFAHRIDNLSVTSLTFGPPSKVFAINHCP